MVSRRPLIVNSTANQIQELTDSDDLSLPNGSITAQSFIGDGSSLTGIFPTGGIVMWSGSIATIPDGWALCNGSNGTPDLRDKFIVGAHSDGASGVTFNVTSGATSGNYGPGNTGGTVAHKLTVAEMPQHNHTYNERRIYQQGSGPNAQTDMANDNPGDQYTGNQGGNNYHENRPPYYALAFIMKL